MIRYLAALLLLASAAGGQTITSVTADSVSTGGEIVIVGTGFGEKPVAAPALWDDFEAGEIDAAIGDPLIGASYSSPPGTYQSGGIDGSQCAVSVRQTTGTIGLVHYWGSGTHKKAFASVDLKFTDGDWTAANGKLLRLNAGNTSDPTHGYPNINLGKERTRTDIYAINNHGLPLPYLASLNSYSSYPSTSWGQWSCWAAVGDSGVANGIGGRQILGTYHQRTIQNNPDGYSGSQSALIHDGFRLVYIAAYLDQLGSTIYIDNAYADSALARAELCNDDDYTMADVRRALPPTYWAADGDSITATIYTYGFADGDSAWLFVHDPDGNRSPAYGPLVIASAYDGGGETPDNAAPGAPVVTRGSGTASLAFTDGVHPDLVTHQVDAIASSLHLYIGTSPALLGIPNVDTITATVSALDADGERISTSAQTVDNGS